ncbi:hypothetical protein [Minwuia sp.]|uniref:hypothetical protein n=1 Tax=Minwuia sp. TaxID=2493630 RepID=UPI003A934A90
MTIKNLNATPITHPKQRRTAALAALLAAGLLAPAAVHANATGTAGTLPSAGNPLVTNIASHEPTRQQLYRQLVDAYVGAELKGDVRSRVINALRDSYEAIDYEPIWNEDSGENLRKAVKDRMSRGLDIHPVTADHIDRLIAARASNEMREAAEADIELSSIYIRMAWQERAGLDANEKAVNEVADEMADGLLLSSVARAASGDVEGSLADLRK